MEAEINLDKVKERAIYIMKMRLNGGKYKGIIENFQEKIKNIK